MAPALSTVCDTVPVLMAGDLPGEMQNSVLALHNLPSPMGQGSGGEAWRADPVCCGEGGGRERVTLLLLPHHHHPFLPLATLFSYTRVSVQDGAQINRNKNV